MAGFAAESGEPVLQDAAAQILPELLFNVWRQSASGGLCQIEKLIEVISDQLVKQGLFRNATLILMLFFLTFCHPVAVGWS